MSTLSQQWTRRIPAPIRAICLLACLLGLLPGRVGAMEKGIQDGWAVDDSDHVLLTPAVARQMRDLGAKWVRLHFRLNARHKSWDPTLDNAYAEAVANLQQQHLQILGLLTYESSPGSQSDWIANNHEVAGGSGDNPYLRNLTEGVFHHLLRRFPTVRSWEIWNEPNNWTTTPPGSADKLPGGFYLYPSNFAWLLRRAYAEAHAASEPVALITGGMLVADFSGNLDSDIAAPYLRATADAGKTQAGWDELRNLKGRWPVDGWGLHVYANAGSRITASDFAAYPTAFGKLMSSLDSTTAGKRIWITEIGWATPSKPGSLSEADQAANVTTTLTTLRTLKDIGPLFWFTLHDVPAADLYYGLFHADDRPKPAVDAFRTAL